MRRGQEGQGKKGARATNASIADERTAFENQNTIRSEILANGGRDIGDVRVFSGRYETLYRSYYTTEYGNVYDRYRPGGK